MCVCVCVCKPNTTINKTTQVCFAVTNTKFLSECAHCEEEEERGETIMRKRKIQEEAEEDVRTIIS